jgi:membrane protease subunit HflK
VERNVQKIGLVNLLAFLVAGAAGLALGLYSHVLPAQVGMVFLGLGFLIAAVSYFQMRLETREQVERLEFDELARSAKSSALFTTTDAEVFPARRSREQFERFFVPAFSVLLFLLQAGGAFLLWRWLMANQQPPALNKPLVALALFGLCFLVLFLLGKYSAGVTRLEGRRLLRAEASYLLLGAYLCFVIAVDIAAVEADFPGVDKWVARGLCLLLSLLALETLITLLLEIYRPRVKGQEVRLLYESRLVGLLAQPEGLITTAAQALDYQFGFKVSDTWFYRFLEKALAWIVLAQLAILLVSTCFVFIETGQAALLERWGAPVAGRDILGPGLHLKCPWPIDKVYRFHTGRIQTFSVGVEPGKEKVKEEKTLLWTVPHAENEFNLMVASREANVFTNLADGEQSVPPANLLTVSVPVQYQIKDLRAWAYQHADAGQLLERIATREVVRYLVSIDLFEIMSFGRAKAAEELRRRIQSSADALGLGAQIVFVGLQDIHPPVKVAPSFESVIATMQETNAKIQLAEAYRATNVPLARAEAEQRVREAESYRMRKVAGVQAQNIQFTNQVKAYEQSPSAFLWRAYLQTLARASTNARKYILTTTNTHDLYQLNLEDKVRTDIIEGIEVPPPKK